MRYVLIGGFTINYYGLPRATEDIDLLVDPSDDNILRIKNALSFLPDNAVREVALDDVKRYEVVRVVDEITIDLLKSDVYIKEKIIPPRKIEDAQHIAIATCNHIDILLSWNFKHLSNIQKQINVRIVNEKEGYFYPLRLTNPMEVIYEND